MAPMILVSATVPLGQILVLNWVGLGWGIRVWGHGLKQVIQKNCLSQYLIFPDWMRGRQARSEACLLTLGLALPELASGEAACLRCPGLWAMSLSRRCSCAVIRLLVPRLRVVLSMLEMLGLLDPEIGLRC